MIMRMDGVGGVDDLRVCFEGQGGTSSLGFFVIDEGAGLYISTSSRSITSVNVELTMKRSPTYRFVTCGYHMLRDYGVRPLLSCLL